jgi:hypothetical protein
MDLLKRAKELIGAGFPAIWVETYEVDDAIRTLKSLHTDTNYFGVWDIDRGLDDGSQLADPLAVLSRFIEVVNSQPPGGAILVMKNLHRFIGSANVLQKIANMLPVCKSMGGTVVIISPVVNLPPEIEKLVTVIPYELPTLDELVEICTVVLEGNAEFVAKPSDEHIRHVASAAKGLTRVEAENAFALSIVRHEALVPDVIWELKAQALERSGLVTLHRGKERFEGLGGLQNIKSFCLRAMRKQGSNDPERRPRGILLLSPPGCGKSQFAKALGNETERPTVVMDVGALMGSLVGQSEGNMRQALKLVDAMAPCVLMMDEIEKSLAGAASSGQTDSGVSARMFGTMLTWLNDHTSDVFVIGTCNDISRLPAPFSRAERFDAVFFVDIPDKAQQQAIWDMYLRHFSLDEDQPTPDHKNWTGAEIRACCRLAALLDVPLTEAAKNIVPVYVSSGDDVDKLRAWASGRCIDANVTGVYQQHGSKKTTSNSAPRRKINREPSEN